MKKLFIILTITLFACNHTTAQGLAKLVGKVASQQSEDKEDKDRYKKIDFSVANSEGQLLYYSILPEGNNTVALVKMDGKKNRYDELHYTIPSNVSFNGTNYTVTEIGDETFDRCKVTSVNLPSTIRKIGAFAFYSSKLNTITIPGSVKKIGRGAFFANESLISITLNEGLEEIGDEAFRCTSITTAIIPNSVKKIGIQAFSCKALQELFVPDNLRNIGNNAFAGAKGLSNYFMYKVIFHLGSLSATARNMALVKMHSMPIITPNSLNNKPLHKWFTYNHLQFKLLLMHLNPKISVKTLLLTLISIYPKMP